MNEQQARQVAHDMERSGYRTSLHFWFPRTYTVDATAPSGYRFSMESMEQWQMHKRANAHLAKQATP
jgi:hypothetical protein